MKSKRHRVQLDMMHKEMTRLKGEAAPFVFLTMDEVTLRCVAEGIVTSRLQEQARELVQAVEAQTLVIERPDEVKAVNQ